MQANYAQVGRWGFTISTVWCLFSAVILDRGYQDSWILDGIWLPFCLAVLCYGLAIYSDREPARTSVLTSALVCLGYSAPLLKYTYVYGSTIDASVHFSMMRNLATTGLPESSVYAYIPGFHVLVASLAQLSGLSVTTWAQLFPGLIASSVPMGAYLLAKRVGMPRSLQQSIIVLSGVSLPLLYLPNGTSYATLVVGPLFLVVLTQASGAHAQKHRLAFACLIVLLGAALIIWHAVSSLLVPMVMILSGLLAILLAMFSVRLGYRQFQIEVMAVSLVIAGMIGIFGTLGYWRYIATPIWEHLIDNVYLFVNVVRANQTSPGVLVPKRTFTLEPQEVAVVFMFHHARDAALVLLVAIGSALNLYSFIRAVQTRWIEPSYIQAVRTVAIIFAVFSLILMATLLSDFAKHGYQRYLLYLITISPVVGGYGLWQMLEMVHRRFRHFPKRAAFAAGVVGIYFVAGLQIYPYQPLVPKAWIPGTDGTTPIYWHHGANTEYQKRAIEFAYGQVPEATYLFTDYKSYQQVAFFLGLSAKQEFHYGTWPWPRSSYVLLHVPGMAGAYGEQAEYRTREAIEHRRRLDGVSTVYDNGGSFLLQVPQTLMEEIYLEERDGG